MSASVSQARPRSNSLLAKSLEPEIVEGAERETMEPLRVGMLRVWAVAMPARRAETKTLVCILRDEVGFAESSWA